VPLVREVKNGQEFLLHPTTTKISTLEEGNINRNKIGTTEFRSGIVESAKE